MTIWRPDLARSDGPKYEAIATAIEHGIARGELLPGTRLPPQRDLARTLGVTIGTVSRGYAEAERRGWVRGEVGRGTFILEPRPPATEVGRTFGLDDGSTTQLLNLGHNAPHSAGVDDVVRTTMNAWTRQADVAELCRYQPHLGSAAHRRAGAAWLARGGLTASADEVVLTCGAQHAMLLALSAVTAPGDVVLAEALSYPGIVAVARFLRLQLVGVAVDAHGLQPEALDEACTRHHPKALYCTPTIQNPTGTVLPLERRRAIAAIAKRHDVMVVEDDTYAFLLEQRPTPIASLLADRTFYVSSMSKSVAPGLRVGFLRCPQRLLDALAGAVTTTTIMASPWTADLAATMIDDGSADRVVAMRRGEARNRQQLARDILAPHVAAGVANVSPHLWSELPEPWRAEAFAAQARARGVAIAPAEVFAVDRVAAPHAVRVTLCAVEDEAQLRLGLETLASLLRSPPVPAFAGA